VKDKTKLSVTGKAKYLKCKDKDKDIKLVSKESSRTRSRTHIPDLMLYFYLLSSSDLQHNICMALAVTRLSV